MACILFLCFYSRALCPAGNKDRKYELHLEQDADAGIRLRVLYFHCLTWRRGTRVMFLISWMWRMQGRVEGVVDAAAAADRCPPAG